MPGCWVLAIVWLPSQNGNVLDSPQPQKYFVSFLGV